MKEENGRSHETARKKLNLYIALGLAAVLLALIVIVTSVALAGRSDSQLSARPNDDSSSSSSSIEPVVDDPAVDVTPEGFFNPVAVMTELNGYGFYHNKTINAYYEHTGVDYLAEAGENVYAVQDGVVEEVYTSDVLVGTRIVVDHGDGIKTVYEFVNAKEGLKAGDKVERGDVIATVAEATGNEYKDGAHLHFEVLEQGENVDPNKYFTLEEK